MRRARSVTAAIQPSIQEMPITVSDLYLILGVLFAFATLIVKIIEVARRK
jgi:hypothetical protein